MFRKFSSLFKERTESTEDSEQVNNLNHKLSPDFLEKTGISLGGRGRQTTIEELKKGWSSPCWR